MRKIKILLVLVLLIILPSINALSIYEYFDALDPAKAVIVYGFGDDSSVKLKAQEFADHFVITEAYSELDYINNNPDDSKTYVIYIGSFYLHPLIEEISDDRNWPFDDLANGYIQVEEFQYKDGGVLFITGDDIDSTISTIDYTLDYINHESELSKSFLMLLDNETVVLDPTCISDSDNGDYYISGTILPYDLKDECIDCLRLREYSCQEELFTVEEVVCPCEEGICVKPGLSNIFEGIKRWSTGMMSYKQLSRLSKEWVNKII